MKLGDIFEDEFGGETPEDKSDSEAAAHMQSDRAQALNEDTAKKLNVVKIMLHARSFEKASQILTALEKSEEARLGFCDIPDIYWYKLLLKYQACDDTDLIAKGPDLEDDEDYILAVEFCKSDAQRKIYQSICEKTMAIYRVKAEEERKHKEEEERQKAIREEEDRKRREEEARLRAIQEEQERKRREEKLKAKTLKNCQIENGVLIKYNGNDSEIFIPDIVTSIGDYAFSENTTLEIVTIPDSVTSIGDWAFSGCTSLTNITIPDSVTSIGDYAFSENTTLESVTIPNSVTSIGEGVFASCTSLTKIAVDNGNKYFKSDDGNLYSYDRTILYQYAIGKTVTTFAIPEGVTSIGICAFSDCTSLTSITIPDSVTSIGSSAFSGCKSLTCITIPNSVTSIGDWAFSDCESLTSITIPGSVTSIGEWAFHDCTTLTNVYFKNTWGWNVSLSWTISLSSYDLSNAFTAAEYLTDEYTAYHWERNE